VTNLKFVDGETKFLMQLNEDLKSIEEEKKTRRIKPTDDELAPLLSAARITEI